MLPKNSISKELKNYHNYKIQPASLISLSFNQEIVSNSGHPNIDNNGEFYSLGSLSRMTSSRFSYYNPWLIIEIEPFIINHSSIPEHSEISGPLQVSNNHTNFIPRKQGILGLKQSRLVLVYKNFGLGYGKMSHWWSHGFHSSLALSSNAPSQETYQFGTMDDLKFGNVSVGTQIILLPYRNTEKDQIYFSGMRLYSSINSRSTILTFGLNRTYLSGNFANLKSTTVNQRAWNGNDALRLLFEPLYGQSKKNLNYTIPNTPGFDIWDELLTGFLKIQFLEQSLEIYAELASDDNRANFVDLRAHWDHTLGYQIGLKKYTRFKKLSLLTAAEFLTTRVSNTFNPIFYRGNPNSVNYYTKVPYDFFSYKGRRMGAHSGTSSEDLIFLLGINDEFSQYIFTYNKERHGIKNKIHPQIKSEISISYLRDISPNHSLYLSFEFEKIKNYEFKINNFSRSNFLWIGYSFLITNSL